MPEASGSVAWCDKAFGPFWAFQKGWLSWVSGVADNALYPILFVDCLVTLMVPTDDPSSLGGGSIFGDASQGGNRYVRWSTILVITVLLTYMNYRGMDVIGKLATVTSVLSLLPFLIFCIMGLPKVDPSRWLIMPTGGIEGVVCTYGSIQSMFCVSIHTYIHTYIHTCLSLSYRTSYIGMAPSTQHVLLEHQLLGVCCLLGWYVPTVPHPLYLYHPTP